MTKTLPGHEAPAVGFEVPLKMLAACHGRVQRQCETLARLRLHVQAHGADRPAQEAARAVCRYFDTAARHHHEDEEHDLFTALLACVADADATDLREMVRSLTDDHRALERRWSTLRPSLLAVGHAACADSSNVDVATFIGSYERHIRHEDDELLPMAARLPGDGELERNRPGDARPAGPRRAGRLTARRSSATARIPTPAPGSRTIGRTHRI